MSKFTVTVSLLLTEVCLIKNIKQALKTILFIVYRVLYILGCTNTKPQK